MRPLLYLALAALSLLYVANPGLGVFELIPDNLPVFGNIDEAAATALFLWAVRRLRGGGGPTPPAPGRGPAPR